MPQFNPGDIRTAIASMSNPTGKSFQYVAELYLGLPKVASSGPVSFSLNPGEARPISFQITMPSEEGVYPVYLDVFAEDILVSAYQAVEDVVIALPAAFTFSNVSAEMVGCTTAPAFRTMNFDCRITNPTDQPFTRTIKMMRKYYDALHPGVTYGPFEITQVRASLTLTPGESYDYHFEGNYYIWPDWYTYVLIALRQTHCLWLEDEIGNKSPEACVSRS